MLTSKDCWERYGDPLKEKSLVVWDVPQELQTGILPDKLYCNKDMVAPLATAFGNVLSRGLLPELKTWDGCFCVRRKRGASSMSLHSWGVAIDLNAATNKMGKKPTLTPEFVACFTDVGLEWGGNWLSPDGMHFQLRG